MSFNGKEPHIVVNYHYVRTPSSEWRGIHPCDPKEFERQVKFLVKEYKIVSIPEVFKAAQTESREKLCAITFDDGFKDNIQNAVPVLDALRVKATFFSVSQTLKGILPTTHKVHVILSKFSVPDLIERFNAFLESRAPRLREAYRISTEERITNERKIFDDIPTANFKETMGIIPRELKKKFLDELFKEAQLNEQSIVKELFMDKDELRKLRDSGHTIGSHGMSHDALDCLSEEEVRIEIESSKKEIQAAIGEDPKIFSYPQSAPSKDVFGILEANGFTHAVIVNVLRGVEKSDHKFFIPRYDTNDIRDYLNGKQ